LKPCPGLSQGAKRTRDITQFLETQIWPVIPRELPGKEATKAEVEELLGLGPYGV
jgi:hypothetical protein